MTKQRALKLIMDSKYIGYPRLELNGIYDDGTINYNVYMDNAKNKRMYFTQSKLPVPNDPIYSIELD